MLPPLDRAVAAIGYGSTKRGGPEIPKDGPFHVFLSHNWKHGQSTMRIIKSRLGEMLVRRQVCAGSVPLPTPLAVCALAF